MERQLRCFSGAAQPMNTESLVSLLSASQPYQRGGIITPTRYVSPEERRVLLASVLQAASDIVRAPADGNDWLESE